jgi:hypothetical protein
VVFAIRPGDQVSVRGLRARAVALIDANSITNVATGRSVVDSGPPDGPGRLGSEQTISGRISAVLHGKQGEVNGAVLEDGATLRLPPPEADRMRDWLRVGQTLSARGSVLDTALGKVVDVSAIGSSPESLSDIGAPRPPAGPDRLGPPPPPRG